ncbi:MAG: hypothetical protein H6Q38_2755 [Chloroflexi bacterium]|nr:hypothetical protein [Chloroflexota bacterium]
MMNTKMTGNAAQVHAIHIQLHRLLAHLIGVTMLFWFGSVLAATMHAAIPLRTAQDECRYRDHGFHKKGKCLCEERSLR